MANKQQQLKAYCRWYVCRRASGYMPCTGAPGLQTDVRRVTGQIEVRVDNETYDRVHGFKPVRNNVRDIVRLIKSLESRWSL